MEENKQTFLQKMHLHLFDEQGEKVVFDTREQDVVIRFRAAFTKWISEPHLRDVQMLNFLQQGFGISERQAYRDLPLIKALVGNITVAAKEFQRHRANEMILKGFEIARDAESNLEIKQALAMIRAGEALVKVHKLDKNDLDIRPFDDIVPLELEPSTDVSVIGRKRIENLEELKRKLRAKYGGEPIQDVEFTEIDDE
ncbi:MAG: hypothetical protein M0R31_06730 [Candidatus Riflebacteria bacterium]|nr:hypothetical protein [Candidatus Riflebacteria bacterium]